MMLALQIPIPSLHLSAVFVGCLLLCILLTKLLLKWQLKFGLDHPDGDRKQHDKVVPRLGGLPIFLTLIAGLAYASFGLQDGGRRVGDWWPIVTCLCIIFAVGFADDLKPLGAKVKLLGQIGVACILFASGYSIDVLTHPTTGGQLQLGWLALPVTLFWLIAIPNIINLIDGMDGLAGGFGLFMCLTLGVIGHFSGMADVVMISTVMAGALSGFLFFNLPPARIFLGDGGAYLIGFFIAALSLASSQKGTIVSALLVMIIALGVPILDTLFAIVRRGVRGVPIFRADAEHIHHRLIQLGYSKPQALLVLYIACALLSLGGITILLSRGMTAVVAGAALVILALLAARYLGYIKSWRSVRQQLREALATRRKLEFARAYGRVLSLEALRMHSVEDFSSILVLGLHRNGFVACPDVHSTTVTVPVGKGILWQLGTSPVHESPNVARRHATELAESVSLALERWNDIPGIQLVRHGTAPEAPRPAESIAPSQAS
jgi:UDP-GlcNAc:undecaprenyl-phosphate/decaprenyl-phosphate GlcNAc-1-phosphate transferase